MRQSDYLLGVGACCGAFCTYFFGEQLLIREALGGIMVNLLGVC